MGAREMRTPSEAVDALFEGMRAGDLGHVMSAIHPEVEVHEADSVPFYPGTFRGSEAFRRDLLGSMLGNYELAINSLTRLDGGDGRVVGLLDLTFTSRATQGSLRTTIVEIYTVQDGQIRHIDVYYKDTAAMVAAFPEGAAQAPA
jgi:ketosteroid isomerase-like protein